MLNLSKWGPIFSIPSSSVYTYLGYQPTYPITSSFPITSSKLLLTDLTYLPISIDASLSLLCSSRQDFSLTAFNCLARVQARQQGGESGLSRPAELRQGRGGLSWCVCSRAATSGGAALDTWTRFFVISNAP